MNLLSAVQKELVNSEVDKVLWKGAKGDRFSVREAYNFLQPRTARSNVIEY